MSQWLPQQHSRHRQHAAQTPQQVPSAVSALSSFFSVCTTTTYGFGCGGIG